jgi:hypothetical protein
VCEVFTDSNPQIKSPLLNSNFLPLVVTGHDGTHRHLPLCARNPSAGRTLAWSR